MPLTKGLDFRDEGSVKMSLPKLNDSTLELNDRVGLLTFCRDDVRNALTGTALVEDIVAAVEWANVSTDISALILTGEGKAFSSGGNVKEMKERTGIFEGQAVEVQDKYRRGIQRMTLAMHRAELPVIAAVNGPAIGAGFDLACMCDVRFGSTGALLGETFLDLGIVPGTGGAWFLQRTVGYQRAFELALTGRMLRADEALDLGIFLDVIDPGELIPTARNFARQIASKPPKALRLTKRLMKAAQRMDLPDLLDLTASFQALAHETKEHAEALDAFFDKMNAGKRG